MVPYEKQMTMIQREKDRQEELATLGNGLRGFSVPENV